MSLLRACFAVCSSSSASRKAFTFAGFLLAALVLLPVPMLKAQSVWYSTLCFSLANAFFGLAPSGFKANYLDITEEYATPPTSMAMGPALPPHGTPPHPWPWDPTL